MRRIAILGLLLATLGTGCVSLKPYKHPAEKSADAPSSSLYKEYSVNPPWFLGKPGIQGHHMGLFGWGDVENYYRSSGDLDAASTMADAMPWKIGAEVGMGGGCAVMLAGVIEGMNGTSNTAPGIGLAVVAVGFSSLIVGNVFYLKPAALHFNQYLKKDLDLTANFDGKTLALRDTVHF